MSEFWIEQLLAPLANGVGEDLTNDEPLFWLKSEVNKSADLDFEKIKSVSIELLTARTRDLRVFSYLWFACAYLDPFSVLMELLGVLHHWLVTHHSDIYPQKPAARLSVLRGFNQRRVHCFFNNRLPSASCLDLEKAKKTIACINGWLKNNGEQFCGEATFLNIENSLKDYRIEKKVFSVHKDVPEAKISPIPKAEPVPTVLVAPAPLPEETRVIGIDQAEKMTLKIIQFYEAENRCLSAAAYRRAMRWAGLTVRADGKHKTELAPFSSEHQHELQTLLSDKMGAKERYTACENLFLRVGGQVKLDLQYHSLQAARAFNAELALFLEQSLLNFLARFPGAEQWTYRDGVACTSLETRAWIQNEFVKQPPLEKYQQEKDATNGSEPLFNMVLNCVKKQNVFDQELGVIKQMLGLNMNVNVMRK